MPWFFTRLNDFTVVFYSIFIIFCVLLVQDWQRLISNLTFLNFNFNANTEYYSSVFCRGNNHTDRICKFKNLCYNSLTKDFLFFHSHKSDIIGLSEDRFSPAVVDFSSVHDHNTQYFYFIDLPSSSFSNFSIYFANGVSLLFKRFNPENLMHVFHDDLIPAYVTLKENFLLNERSNVYFVFADGREPGPYAYIYENFLDIQPMYLNTVSEQVICFENVIVGLNKHSLWYQYGFREPQGPLNKDMMAVYPTLVNFREYFCAQFHLDEISVERTALLLNRKHNRKIVNTEAVVNAVESVTNFKTHVISLENYSVMEVIKKIRASRLVLGVHGSLLILSLFLPQNSHIIELFPYGVDPNICTPYRTLAEIPGLELVYHSWENKIEENSFPHPEYPADLGGIMHLPEDMQGHIKRSIVKPFLCCYNAEWLYRIYQDTFVDLKSFSVVLNNVHADYQTNNSSGNFVKLRFYPSEVQNILCHLNSKNIYTISWEKPWNLQFLNVTLIEYELWYQIVEKDDIKAFIMKKNHFSFQEEASDIYVWIRCHIDGRIGPFNTDPFICQK